MTDDEIIAGAEARLARYRALIAKLTARIEAADNRKSRKALRQQIRTTKEAARRLEAMLT